MLSRRGLLAAGAGAGTLALAGCSQVLDFLAGFILEDVNVFNGVTKQVSGSIEVRDPGDEAVLNESFSLMANEEGTDPSRNPNNESSGNESQSGNESSGNQSGNGNDSAASVTPLQSGNASENQNNNQSNNESNNESSANDDPEGGVTYSDVFTETGSYTVSLTLDEGSDIWGRRESEQTVEISDTGDEHIMVFLGAKDADKSKRDGPFLITAINDFSDLESISEGDVNN